MICRFPQPAGMCAFLLWATACSSVHSRRSVYIDFIRVDERPPLVGQGALADSVFGPKDESEAGDGIAESRRADLEALVRRYTPSLVLPSGDYVVVDGRKYRLLPTDVFLFADTLRVDLVGAAPYSFHDSLGIPFRKLEPDSLRALVEAGLKYEADPQVFAVWYFDFPGTRPREWWQAYGRLRTGPDSARWAEPTVYAHPFLDPAGRWVIQYWYSYPFNDWLGNHEGDWEHVNVVLTADRAAIAEVHYYFHNRSVRLPQGPYVPEIVDETHPVVYVGGRAYNVFDFPIRLFGGDRNEGSHGSYPYAGEWEAAGGLGTPESVGKGPSDSTRFVPHDRFRVRLTPEPSRIDYLRNPEVLTEWAWLVLPVRWGFPIAPSIGSGIRMTDVGNRAPFGPAFNAGWNRTAPGLLYPAFQVRRIHPIRGVFEDLVQPWYYLYLFRFPRYVHDTRGALSRSDLARLGLAPRGGWAERGLGSSLFGVHVAYPRGEFSDAYGTSLGISLWRSFWAKARVGPVELVGGYQRFRRTGASRGSLFVYPITAGVTLRAPDAWLRPYAGLGAGAYGWESRVEIAAGDDQRATSGWNLGWTAAGGVEYYLRPRLALDVAVRYHSMKSPGAPAGLLDPRLSFVTLWVGHYVRF